MSEKSAEQIESRNKKYLEELSVNIGKYFSYLSTMARFHKYEVEDLTSFAIEVIKDGKHNAKFDRSKIVEV